MAAGDEEVAAELARRRRFRAEAVHAVDAEQDTRVGSASAIARIGSFTPVLECTHVTASARVFGVIARRTDVTISSTEAVRAFW